MRALQSVISGQYVDLAITACICTMSISVKTYLDFHFSGKCFLRCQHRKYYRNLRVHLDRKTYLLPGRRARCCSHSQSECEQLLAGCPDWTSWCARPTGRRAPGGGCAYSSRPASKDDKSTQSIYHPVHTSFQHRTQANCWLGQGPAHQHPPVR